LIHLLLLFEPASGRICQGEVFVSSCRDYKHPRNAEMRSRKGCSLGSSATKHARASVAVVSA